MLRESLSLSLLGSGRCENDVWTSRQCVGVKPQLYCTQRTAFRFDGQAHTLVLGSEALLTHTDTVQGAPSFSRTRPWLQIKSAVDLSYFPTVFVR